MIKTLLYAVIELLRFVAIIPNMIEAGISDNIIIDDISVQYVIPNVFATHFGINVYIDPKHENNTMHHNNIIKLPSPNLQSDKVATKHVNITDVVPFDF